MKGVRVPQRVASWSLLACFLIAPAWAEETPPSFGETVRVEVADVDVVVTDRAGKPVTGLTRDDFELFIDGNRQEIANFYAIESGRRYRGEAISVAGGTAEPRGTAAGRQPQHVVIYIDDANLSPVHRNRALMQMGPFIESRLERGDRVMVASYDTTVRVRQGFTAEWKPLAEAVESLMKSSTLGAGPDAQQWQALRELNNFERIMEEGRRQETCTRQLQDLAENQARAELLRIRNSVASLQAFTDSLAGLPGRKSVLYISDGIPLIAGRELFEYLALQCGGRGVTQGMQEVHDFNSGGFDPGKVSTATLDLDMTRFSAQPLLAELTEHANAARATIFSLEATGPRGVAAGQADFEDPRLAAGSLDSVRVSNLQDSLFTMADDTGGRAILNATQLLPALEEIAAALDTYYSLGFSPPAAKGARRVEVKVRRSGVDVNYRKSVQTKTTAERLADRTMGTLLFGVEDNPLGIEAVATRPAKLDESLFMVPVRVRIPIGKLTLVPGETAHTGRLSLHVASRDRQGRLAPVRAVEIPLTVPNDQLEVARTKFYVYEVKMLMREGEHSLAVGLEDTVGAVASFVSIEVPVSE